MATQDWMRKEAGWPRHWKVYRFAELFDLDRQKAVGALDDLHDWILMNEPSGEFQEAAMIAIAHTMEMPGKGPELLAGLLECRLVDDKGDGLLYLHNWEAYHERTRATKKKREQRAKEKLSLSVPNCPELSRIVPTMSPSVPNCPSLQDRTGQETTGQEIRGDVEPAGTPSPLEQKLMTWSKTIQLPSSVIVAATQLGTVTDAEWRYAVTYCAERGKTRPGYLLGTIAGQRRDAAEAAARPATVAPTVTETDYDGEYIKELERDPSLHNMTPEEAVIEIANVRGEG